MTKQTKAQLAKTVEMSIVELKAHLSYYSELEVAVLCYLADFVVGNEFHGVRIDSELEHDVTDSWLVGNVTMQDLSTVGKGRE